MEPHNTPYSGRVSIRCVAAGHLQFTWGRMEKQVPHDQRHRSEKGRLHLHKDRQLAPFSSFCEASIAQTSAPGVKCQSFTPASPSHIFITPDYWHLYMPTVYRTRLTSGNDITPRHWTVINVLAKQLTPPTMGKRLFERWWEKKATLASIWKRTFGCTFLNNSVPNHTTVQCCL